MELNRRAPLVLIVEDHPLIVDSLVACIRSCNPQVRFETANSIRVATAILERKPAPALIVTDLTLTDCNGVATVAALRDRAPSSPLLVFTALDDPELRRGALDLGAIDYLIKSVSAETLCTAMCAVLGSGKTPPAQPRSDDAETADDPPRLANLLTKRQIVVLRELAAGRSNKEIALRLTLSDQTIGSHVKEILSRLGVRNRTEAVASYFELNSRDEHQRRKTDRPS